MELYLLDWMQVHLRSGAMDLLMVGASRLGDGGLVWILIAAFLLLRRETRMAGAAVGLALILEVTVANGILKPLIDRPRPFAAGGMTALLIAPPMDASFPSGHTSASFAAALALCRSRSCLWPWALALALVISFSRLYLYVHYPSDVIAGLLIGWGCGWVSVPFVHQLFRCPIS